MSRKVLAQVSVLVLLLLAFLVTPLNAQAGGVCGGTYIVEWGQTLDMIAAMCGTSVSAIYAANPGISATLYAGQALMLPGSNYSSSGISSVIYNDGSSNYNNYDNYNYYPAVSYNGAYIVQFSDTFSGVASRFGVSMYDLWAANPNIWNINLLYAGQVIRVPASSGQVIYVPTYPITVVPVPTAEPVPLSYGTVPAGTPYAGVKLINRSSGDIYVSLQGTTRDGISVINEYPVGKSMKVNVPAGWYVYVAWVNGQKFSGQFQLANDSTRTITFQNSNVSVE